MYKIIGSDQKEYGPISVDQLRQWIAEGRINAQTLVMPVGGAQWQAISTLPEFAASFPGGATSPPPLGAVPAGKVPNYLVQSILVTLCCCLPLGIVAIVYAAQVNGKLQNGDYPGAVLASNNAKKWCWISFGLGIVVNIIAGVVQLMISMKGLGH